MLKRKKLHVESLESRELMKAPDEAPSLGPPPSPSSSVVWVDTVAELQSAVQNLVSNQTIVVEPGTYQLTRTLFVGKDRPVQNVTIRGSTDDFDDVVIKGLGMDGPFNSALAHGISVYNAQDVTIANLSVGEVYWHAIDLQGGAGAERVHLYHCRFFNAGEQILKSNSGGGGVDDCSIEYSLIEFTNGPSTVDHGGGTGYTGGIHAHETDRWNIRHNLWRNFHTPDNVSHLFAPVVLMWNNSSETVVEGNTFIDCDRAVAFGLVDKAGGTDHHGGIIRNNFVYQRPGLFTAFRRAESDGQLLAYDSPGTTVVHNTVLTNGNSRFSIEVRWGNTGVEFKNNLADAPLNSRDGGTYSASGNFLQALPSMFESPATGNLHLLDTSLTRTSVIDRAGSGTDEDFDGDQRSTADIGADEFSATNNSPLAVDDARDVNEDSRIVIDARTNDIDPDGDTISIVSITQASHGKATLAGGILTYVPNTAYVGTDLFTYTISDGHGGSDTASVNITVNPQYDTVALEPDPWNPTTKALVVRGTAGDDQISFRPSGTSHVLVNVNGVSRGRFSLAVALRFVVRAKEGNDLIEIIGSIARRSQLEGGVGNDTLRGGISSDVLLGGSGDDQIFGGRGHDVLVGGSGADLIHGRTDTLISADKDLLIAGTTAHDDNDTAWWLIQKEWRSTRTYLSRSRRLSEGISGLPPLNGSTVFADSSNDSLFGGGGTDWFFADSSRDSTDRKEWERMN